jgi:sarcosine oxidase
MQRADIAIVGAGVMGAATAMHLARSGRRVVLLERHTLGHAYGSSHGTSRVFRLSYPDPDLVRFARQALDGWRELEEVRGEQLLLRNGSLDLGGTSEENAAALEAAGERCERLTGREAGWRWPIATDPDERALFQPDGATILSDRAHQAMADAAIDAGCELIEHTTVASISADGAGVHVHSDGIEFVADAVVVAAGAWSRALLQPLGVDLDVTVTRETVVHFALDGAAELPVLIDGEVPPRTADEPARPEQITYALTSPGIGLKVGLHDSGPTAEPDVRGVPQEDVVRWAASWSARRFPQIDPSPAAAETCLYTSTPNARFVIERRGRLVVGSACSGHGFKFAPAVGRRLAELATDAIAS